MKPSRNVLNNLQQPILCCLDNSINSTVNPVLSGHSKRRLKIGFQDRLSLNAGRKYREFAEDITHLELSFLLETSNNVSILS